MDRFIDDNLREPNEIDRERAAGSHAPDLPRSYDIARLREQIDSATKDRPTLSELVDRLARLGIHVVPSYQKSGRLNGMSYESNGWRYRGSELGRGYTASGLQRLNGVRYDPERDDPRLKQLEREAREQPDRQARPLPDLRDRNGRAREYERLTESERAVLREVGQFRSVLTEDLVAIRYPGQANRRSNDLHQLSQRNLIGVSSVVVVSHDKNRQAQQRTLEVVALTKAGKELMRRFDAPTREAKQSLYAGLVKPREIAHDTAIYRMFHAEAKQIAQGGGRVKRVVLDFELKRKAFAPLAKVRQISPEEYKRIQENIAHELGLKIVGGKIRLPDLRIEYETANGEAARVDLELATEHYRGDHMAAKEQAGFKIYADSRSFPPGGSSGKSAVWDDHTIEIFSF